ncbi:MAG: flavodoxin family protein [Bacillota bacterium]
MKATILQGSPKKDGNTATLANSFINGWVNNGENEAAEYFLNGMNIKQCQGCLKCQESLETLCVINDDMQKVYRDFLESDIIVFATPIYWWHVTGQMKLLIDRLQALLRWDNTANFKGKTLVLILTYGVEDAVGEKTVLMMFEDIAQWAGVKLHVLRYCSASSHVSACGEKLEEARILGESLASVR